LVEDSVVRNTNEKQGGQDLTEPKT